MNVPNREKKVGILILSFWLEETNGFQGLYLFMDLPSFI